MRRGVRRVAPDGLRGRRRAGGGVQLVRGAVGRRPVFAVRVWRCSSVVLGGVLAQHGGAALLRGRLLRRGSARSAAASPSPPPGLLLLHDGDQPPRELPQDFGRGRVFHQAPQHLAVSRLPLPRRAGAGGGRRHGAGVFGTAATAVVVVLRFVLSQGAGFSGRVGRLPVAPSLLLLSARLGVFAVRLAATLRFPAGRRRRRRGRHWAALGAVW